MRTAFIELSVCSVFTFTSSLSLTHTQLRFPGDTQTTALNFPFIHPLLSHLLSPSHAYIHIPLKTHILFVFCMF
jgi:hypothetical protein